MLYIAEYTVNLFLAGLIDGPFIYCRCQSSFVLHCPYSLRIVSSAFEQLPILIYVTRLS